MHSFDYVEGPLLGNPGDFLASKEPFTFGHQTLFHSENCREPAERIPAMTEIKVTGAQEALDYFEDIVREMLFLFPITRAEAVGADKPILGRTGFQ